MVRSPGPSNQIVRAAYPSKLSGWRKQNTAVSVINIKKKLMAGIAMCDKCIEDEKRIDHYQALARTIPDQKALDAINGLIMELRSAKAARHPARED
jgi:hypothetical protein